MMTKHIDQFKINVYDLYHLMRQPTPFTFIDVRMPDLFNASDYSQGDGYQLVHIPYIEFEDDLPAALAKLPPGKLVFICRSGNKTRIVMDIIKDQPLDMVWLDGGLRAWRSFYQTTPVFSSDAGSILQVARPGRGDLSYLIVSQGEAALIDPMRDTQEYLDLITANNARLTHIFDTHNHADRISGGRFLADISSAPYHKHPYDAVHLVDRLPMQTTYQPLWDGDLFTIGAFALRTIWFPGHTLGMTNFLLTTPQGKQFLFTGDGIFIQSIGRPDLMGKGEPWAAILYESLNQRLKPFVNDDTIVLPAHFQLFREINSDGVVAATMANLRRTNPMLRPMTQEAFSAYVLKGVAEAPDDYLEILRINHALQEVSEERAMDLEAGKNLCSATIEQPATVQ
jgi:glyoxylase-like metal-dependent hydrolase (beta-lactamase superfamily II)